MSKTDRVARASAINEAAKAIQWEVNQHWDASRTDVPQFRERIAAVLDNYLPTEFTEAVWQARAEHLESALAKVREECELITENLRPESLTGSFAESILAILNESGEAAGGSK